MNKTIDLRIFASLLISFCFVNGNPLFGQCEGVSFPSSMNIILGDEVNLLAFYDGVEVLSCNVNSPSGGCNMNGGNSFVACECGEYIIMPFVDGVPCPEEIISIELDMPDSFDYEFTNCGEVEFSVPFASESCSYSYYVDGPTISDGFGSYVLEGSTINSSDGNAIFDFQNGGAYEVTLEIDCPSCDDDPIVITEEVDVPITEASLVFSSDLIYFDPNFGTYVLCSQATCEEISISDNSTGLGNSYNLEIVSPDGIITNLSTLPSGFLFEMCDYGEYDLNYSITNGSCTSVFETSVFFGNSNISTGLDVSANIPASSCEGDVITVEVCSNGCQNPDGTRYWVEMDCAGFRFDSETIPFSVDIVLGASSCNSSCSPNGGTSPTLCACDIVVFAWNPCAPQVSYQICPLIIEPQPDAVFEMIPPKEDNIYCLDEDVRFVPEWEPTDCNGFNPSPSVCEIQNPQWVISPNTGWDILDGDLTENEIELDFTVPGNYDICFQWSNNCGYHEWCDQICVIDDPSVAVVWGQLPSCIGDVFLPEASLQGSLCDNITIDWEVSPSEDVTAVGLESYNPSFTFNSKGTYTITASLESDCGEIEESIDVEIFDQPLIEFLPCLSTAPGVEICLGEFVELTDCGDPITDLSFEIDGSDYDNPTGSEPCVLIEAEGSYSLEVEATNGCGTTINQTDVEVSLSSICQVTSDLNICAGEEITPIIEGASNCVWFESDDGVIYTQISVPFVPLESNFYYSSCQNEGGCGCLSDTISFNIDELPQIEINSNNTNPCLGDEVTLSLDDDSFNYEWVGTGIENLPFTFVLSGDSLVEVSISYSDFCDPILLSLEILIDPNPLIIDCADLLNPICNNDLPVSLPDIYSTDLDWSLSDGSWSLLNDAGVVIVVDPTELDPVFLGNGDFELIYFWINENGCEFEVGCEFTISDPSPVSINSLVDLPCHGVELNFDEANNINVEWSITGCNTTIDLEGIVQTANCNEGDVLQVIADGNCIIPDTLNVTILELPQAQLGPDEELCLNECFSLPMTSDENIQDSEWTADGGLISGSFCPSDFGYAGGDVVEICLNVIHENQCSAQDCLELEIQGLPDLNSLPDSLCLNASMAVPVCLECDPDGSLEIVHQSDENVELQSFGFPGVTEVVFDAPGDYDYSIIGVLGECQIELIGEVHVISLPEVNLVQPEYDDCAIDYSVEVEFSGEDSSFFWTNPQIDPTIEDIGNNLFSFDISYPDTSQVNFTYVDTLILLNSCSSDTAIISSAFTSLPGFSVDNDSIICSGSSIDFVIDLLYPVTVDEFIISSDYPEFETMIIQGAPPEVISMILETDNTEQSFTFTFEAINHCGSLIFESVVFVYPADLVYDVELFYDVPLCPGDSIVAELVENFGQESAIQFDNLDEGHLSFVGVEGNFFTFTLNDVPDGTYFLEASMQSSNCPTVVDSDPIIVGPTIVASINDLEACPDDELSILNEVYVQNSNYEWTSYGSIPPEEQFDEVGTFPFVYEGVHLVVLEVSHEDFCPNEDSAFVTIHTDDFLQTITFSPSEIDPYNPYVEFDFSSSEVVQTSEWYNLSNGQEVEGVSALLYFVSQPCDTETVLLKATSIYGCVDSLIQFISTDAMEIYLPNAITIDNDGLNDAFYAVFPDDLKFSNFHIQIFSRWGDEVFSSKDPEFVWNGGKDEAYVINDMYNYRLGYKIEGDDEKGCDPVELFGVVTVIR